MIAACCELDACEGLVRASQTLLALDLEAP
jgi:hypothetical protein